MENVFNTYETLFITDVSNGEEATQATVEKFTSLIGSNGEIISVNKWGKRRLAYPINDMPEGYYTLVEFDAKPDFPAELDRVYKITDGIIRSIIVAKE